MTPISLFCLPRRRPRRRGVGPRRAPSGRAATRRGGRSLRPGPAGIRPFDRRSRVRPGTAPARSNRGAAARSARGGALIRGGGPAHGRRTGADVPACGAQVCGAGACDRRGPAARGKCRRRRSRRPSGRCSGLRRGRSSPRATRPRRPPGRGAERSFLMPSSKGSPVAVRPRLARASCLAIRGIGGIRSRPPVSGSKTADGRANITEK